ncbi:MAG: hypothetical protein AAGG79_04005, partial [Pseudomonadota bacterium]
MTMHMIRSTALLAAAVAQALFALRPDLVGIEGSIGETARSNSTLLIPSGFAFSIWGLLYFGGVYVALWHAMRPERAHVARVGLWALLAFSGNAAWALHQPTYGPGFVSFMLLEFILVCSLLAGYIGQRSDPAPSRGDAAAYDFLLALAGWITVASPAGLSVALVQVGLWPLFGNPVVAALVILAVWAPIAAAIALRLGAFSYLLPILWGLFWVGIANQEEAVVLAGLGTAGAIVVG